MEKVSSKRVWTSLGTSDQYKVVAQSPENIIILADDFTVTADLLPIITGDLLNEVAGFIAVGSSPTGFSVGSGPSNLVKEQVLTMIANFAAGQGPTGTSLVHAKADGAITVSDGSTTDYLSTGTGPLLSPLPIRRATSSFLPTKKF